MEQFAVPFSYSFAPVPLYVHVEVQGVLRIEPAGLALEYREKRTEKEQGRVSVAESDTRTVTIPWRELQAVRYRDHWFRRPEIVMRTFRMASFQSIPGVRGNELRLRIRWSDDGLARELLSQAALVRAEAQPRQIGGEETGSLPSA